MKTLILFCVALCTVSVISAQSPGDHLKYVGRSSTKASTYQHGKTAGIFEICNNGIDDDGDNLVDMEDYACYFGNVDPDNCIPSTMVWATLKFRLYWVNIANNKDRRMDFPVGESYGDIAWAPNGKLYGAEEFSGQIREINPANAQTQLVSTIAGYDFCNGMVSDAQSNLYLCARVAGTTNTWHVVKYNVTTHQVSFVANLSAAGLVSAGDATFLNGFLYVSCEQSKIAKINLADNSVQAISYTGAGSTASMGLITLGDGYLYICQQDDLFRLDPNTWVSTFFYHLPTYGFMFGLSTYPEFCNAPGCRAKVNISVISSPPFCSNTGVQLKANGQGITGVSGYTWTLPDNSQQTGSNITAFTSGKYYARFHTLPDTCGAVDSVTVNITPFPNISLGADTLICPGSTLLIQPSNTQGVLNYLWQDGSTGSNYLASQSGLYWLAATNGCGTKRDSVFISPGTPPGVNLGNDTIICMQSSITLKNFSVKQSWDTYQWSDLSTTDQLIVQHPGVYWLQSKNTCGTVRDSIFITPKDSCICKPFFAAVDLGASLEICDGQNISIINNLHQNGYRYRWQDGNTANSIMVNKPGSYWVDVSSYCNTVRDTITVSEKTNCNCSVYIPTAFTPNNDGINDLFKPLCFCGIKGELIIYNRYGNIIYRSSALQNGWDGRFKNTKQPNGAYTYYLVYKVESDPKQFTEKGSFLLLR